eukprot:TRINITY_DN10409_c0_g1_i1.p2 TRINITY_DN10409_c0_g1~~TRINITY_DN10409_c0_g1_i1.p2  ORF type:complete len:155 (-),score=55.28 TRINITY_DN10409_c0_g1_i1:64-528(-)
MKTEVCSFSGYKIAPGRGSRFVRSDAKLFFFLNSKTRRYFHLKKKPAKFTWTTTFRKMHKKGLTETTVRKRARRVHIAKERGVTGAPIALIQKRRAQKPEERKKEQEVALKELKARRDAKKAARKEANKGGAGPKAAGNVKNTKGGNKPNMKGR